MLPDITDIKRLTIAAIVSDDELLQRLVLKGGNALRLAHQQTAGLLKKPATRGCDGSEMRFAIRQGGRWVSLGASAGVFQQPHCPDLSHNSSR